jgi:hypothetical protein
MINFEEELKRFKPMPEINQAEEAIYNNDLKDVSDIVAQMAEELKKNYENMMNNSVSRIRR